MSTETRHPAWQWVALGLLFWAALCGWLGYDHGYTKGAIETQATYANSDEGRGRYQFIMDSNGIMYRADTVTGEVASYYTPGKEWVLVTGPLSGPRSR